MNDGARPPQSDLAIPPGATLRETIDELGLTQRELSRRLGRPVKTVNEIVQGKAQITPETAIQLERVLGVPAAFWNNLETRFQEALAHHRAEADLKSQVDLARRFPYGEMAKLGWVARTQRSLERVAELLRFFGVASLDLVRFDERAAYRVGNRTAVSPGAIAAWLRQGEREALRQQAAPYNEEMLRGSIPELRALTLDPDFSRKMKEICARAGVIVAFVPHLQKTYANGAARWLTPRRALVQLSLRYPWEDVFWFSFFHELGHVLLHAKRLVFLDTAKDAETGEMEAEADKFAADCLIPPRELEVFLSCGTFTANGITSFAREIGVTPGVVVGRLQHEGQIGFHMHQGIRRRFRWASAESQERQT